MTTIRKSASVKVMLSYNYCHFEASMSLENEDGVTNKDIDDARKDCNRLCDKAISQYKRAKAEEIKRSNQQYERATLEKEVSQIRIKPKDEWTVVEQAKVKALEDYNWEAQFNYEDSGDEIPF